jgi:23S rRNA (guanosine2251-2'-O)-methyltransferase
LDTTHSIGHGYHAVAGLLKREPERVHALWIDESRRDRRARQLIQSAREAGIRVTAVTRRELDRKCAGARHQGFVVEVRGTVAQDEAWLEQMLAALVGDPLLLVLDGITDPHNLGACLRNADAAGVAAVVVPRDRAAGLTAAVRRVASGAAESVPLVQVTNLERTLRELALRGVWIVGAADDAGDSLYDSALTGPLALVLGAEERGMRRLTRERCDRLVSIPMLGSVSSLNVSVATAVVLFEAVRQRKFS